MNLKCLFGKHDWRKHGNQYGSYRYCKRCGKRELIKMPSVWVASLTGALRDNPGIEIKQEG